METLRSRKALEEYIRELKTQGKTIGFAPTMGALHQGHLSLYEKSHAENDCTISSIFVNPTQFNNPEDLEKYPRTEADDLAKLSACGWVDAVYLPTAADLYGTSVQSEPYDFGALGTVMEGSSRPGHFDGVATVVKKLFEQVQPDRAYFGEKDYQQLAIIRQLVLRENLPVKIIAVPTKREADGLAMSSRNMRLGQAGRAAAPIIYRTLQQVNDWFRVVSIPEIEDRVKKIFEDLPGMQLEYFVIADEATLQKTDFIYPEKSYRAFIVVVVEGVRLIDNMHLD